MNKIQYFNSITTCLNQGQGKHFTVCAGGIAQRNWHFFVFEPFFDDDRLDCIVKCDTTFRHIKNHEMNFKSPFEVQGLEYLTDMVKNDSLRSSVNPISSIRT